jgi:hypothetical protein
MVYRIIIINICVCLIVFSVFRFKADADMHTARKWFASRNITNAFIYTKKAIKYNPTEQKYYKNLRQLEQFYFALTSETVKN